MDIMRGFGIPVPKSAMGTNVDEVNQAYKTIIGDGKDCVIKAMVLTGGRGLGHFSNGFKGGVHLCSKPGDVSYYASQMLGQNLITKQTTSEGMPCSKVMLAERMYMRREMYISIMLDRAAGGPIFIASPAGGTSIEDVAAATPELIFKQPIDIMEGKVYCYFSWCFALLLNLITKASLIVSGIVCTHRQSEEQNLVLIYCFKKNSNPSSSFYISSIGITDKQKDFLATSLGFTPGTASHTECMNVVEKLYTMFRAHDCTLVEVNPMAETPDGRVVVCDAKINFDDNAEFRQGAVFKQRDRTQEDWREVEAAKFDLNYIGLTGNIGCMVNGAGLAMATMDIIKVRLWWGWGCGVVLYNAAD